MLFGGGSALRNHANKTKSGLDATLEALHQSTSRLSYPVCMLLFPVHMPSHLGSKGEARVAGTQGGHEVVRLGNLGLHIIGALVDVVARVDNAARHGIICQSIALLIDGKHLLDVVIILGMVNSRDVEEGLAFVTAKADLANDAVLVGLALLDGVEHASEAGGEVDFGLLVVVDGDGVHLRGARAGHEVDSALNSVEGPEADRVGGDGSGGGSKAKEGLGEVHFDLVCERAFE